MYMHSAFHICGIVKYSSFRKKPIKISHRDTIIHVKVSTAATRLQGKVIIAILDFIFQLLLLID